MNFFYFVFIDDLSGHFSVFDEKDLFFRLSGFTRILQLSLVEENNDEYWFSLVSLLSDFPRENVLKNLHFGIFQVRLSAKISRQFETIVPSR